MRKTSKLGEGEEISTFFIDLDGTLWEDSGPGQITNFRAQKLAADKLIAFSALFNEKPNIFIFTNQTAAARRKKFLPYFWLRVTLFLSTLRFRNIITDYYVCYHHPNAENWLLRKNCNCRKPLPGSIKTLSKKYNLSNSVQYVIGDRITDILAGELADVDSKFLIFGKESLSLNEIPDTLRDVKSQSCTFLPVNSWDEISGYING